MQSVGIFEVIASLRLLFSSCTTFDACSCPTSHNFCLKFVVVLLRTDQRGNKPGSCQGPIVCFFPFFSSVHAVKPAKQPVPPICFFKTYGHFELGETQSFFHSHAYPRAPEAG